MNINQMKGKPTRPTSLGGKIIEQCFLQTLLVDTFESSSHKLMDTYSRQKLAIKSGDSEEVLGPAIYLPYISRNANLVRTMHGYDFKQKDQTGSNH